MDIPLVKKEILTNLLKSNGLKYSEAMPKDVENDLYNYHLQHLIKQNLVEKIENKYFLTDIGKKYVEVGNPINPLGNITELFRVNTLLILIKEENGKAFVLNQVRKRHPFYGDKGIIGGAVKHGELLEDAYTRILYKETGLTAIFKTIGIIRKIRMLDNGDLFSDIFYQIGFSNNPIGNLIESNEFGNNYWVDIDTAIKNEQTSVQGGNSIIKVLERLKSNLISKQPLFYYQEVMNVEI